MNVECDRERYRSLYTQRKGNKESEKERVNYSVTQRKIYRDRE